jgi:hypothetical protein
LAMVAALEALLPAFTARHFALFLLLKSLLTRAEACRRYLQTTVIIAALVCCSKPVRDGPALGQTHTDDASCCGKAGVTGQ